MFYLISLLITLILPFLIVGFWRSRPRWAFGIAAITLFLFLVTPPMIKTFQAMMIYGTGDPQLMAGGLSEAITGAIFKFPLGLILLFGFQKFVRRNDKKPLTKKDIEDTFT